MPVWRDSKQLITQKRLLVAQSELQRRMLAAELAGMASAGAWLNRAAIWCRRIAPWLLLVASWKGAPPRRRALHFVARALRVWPMWRLLKSFLAVQRNATENERQL